MDDCTVNFQKIGVEKFEAAIDDHYWRLHSWEKKSLKNPNKAVDDPVVCNSQGTFRNRNDWRSQIRQLETLSWLFEAV
jgi:hypothetical protein